MEIRSIFPILLVVDTIFYICLVFCCVKNGHKISPNFQVLFSLKFRSIKVLSSESFQIDTSE